jgi:hypothetical protein
MTRGAGTHDAATEAVPADQRGEVEEIAAEFAAGRGRRQERHVVRQRTEITGVVGQSFQFQRDRAQPLRAQRRLPAA